MATSISGFLDLLISVRDVVWTPFATFFTKRGVPNGFGEGEYLAGRVLAYSDEAASYSDEALDSLIKIGDDLAEAGIELSDEAAQGMGKLATALPEDNFQRIVHNLCPSGLTLVNDHRTVGLASPLVAPACNVNFQKILENIGDWDETVLTGYKKLGDAGIDSDTLATFLVKYADEPVTSKKLLGIIGESSATWTWKSFNGLVKVTDEFGAEAIEHIAKKYADDVVEKTSEIYWRALTKLENSKEFENLTEIVKRYDHFDTDNFVFVLDKGRQDAIDVGLLRSTSPSDIDLLEQALFGKAHFFQRHGPSMSFEDMKLRVIGKHPTIPPAKATARFSDAATMDDAINKAFKGYKSVFEDYFVNGDTRPKGCTFEYGLHLGDGIINHGTINNPNLERVSSIARLNIVFARHPQAPNGFYLLTAYPLSPNRPPDLC